MCPGNKPGGSDQHRNGEEGRADFSPGQEQRDKKRGGRSRVARGKGIVVGAETRPVPNRFRLYGWARPAGGDFDDADGAAGECAGNEHGEENSNQVSTVGEKSNGGPEQTYGDLRRPIGDAADKYGQ